jgi:hypothetical protein
MGWGRRTSANMHVWLHLSYVYRCLVWVAPHKLSHVRILAIHLAGKVHVWLSQVGLHLNLGLAAGTSFLWVGIMETWGLSLKYDWYPFDFSLTAVDGLPVDIYHSNSPLKASVACEELLALIFNKFVDQPATVGWRDFVHYSFDWAFISSEFGQLALEVLNSDMLLLGLDILPGFSVLPLLKGEQR